MDTEGLVYMDLDGAPVLTGRLWARMRKGRDSATFEYDEDWLAHPARFSLKPVLQLGPGPYHTPIGKLRIPVKPASCSGGKWPQSERSDAGGKVCGGF